MIYKIVTARILNDGSIVEGKRLMTHIHPGELRVGGLYFLGPYRSGKLYRVVEKIGN